MKIFYLRHQAAGIIWEHPFAEHPTAEQQAPLLRLCHVRYGAAHPKTGAPYWVMIEAVELVHDGEIPSPIMPDTTTVPSGSGAGEMSSLTATGHGRIQSK